MNQKVFILLAGILAGAGAVYFLTQGQNNSNQPQAAPSAVTAPETPASTPAPHAQPSTSPAPAVKEAPVQPATAKAAAPVSAWARLSEKYGAEKTALSSKITSNLTSVINQGIELANTAARNSGAASVAESAARDLVRGASKELALTDEQKEKATTVMQAAVTKRMNAINELTTAMSSEPEQMMELFLAGDALARKEITQDEYDRLTQPTRTMLQNLSGFVAGKPTAGNEAQVFGDPETTAQLNAILTPEQQTKLAEMTTKWAQQVQARHDSQANSGAPFQFGQIPVMQLDQLDQSVASLRQMTEAARMMMDAMKGLKEANANSGNGSR